MIQDIMKRKIKLVLVVCLFAVLLFAFAEYMEKNLLTVNQAAEYLLEYIYPEEDVLSLCTIYYEESEEVLDTVYHQTRYPVYQFQFPDNPLHTTIQLYCRGEVGMYLIFSLYRWNYFESEEGVFIPSHANFTSDYAINRQTKEIIVERVSNEETDYLWEYNDAFAELFRENELVTREFYD